MLELSGKHIRNVESQSSHPSKTFAISTYLFKKKESFMD